jgi:hypothetical protein
MYPPQAAPVIRPFVPPYFDDLAYRTAHTITTPRLDPRTGEPVTQEPLQLVIAVNILGELEDPNHRQYFREPILCQDWCALFSGFSMMACLRMCR